MFQQYPTTIPKTGTDPDLMVDYKVADPVTKEVQVKQKMVEQIVVKSEAEHKAKNMDHYLAMQAAKPMAPVTANEAINGERERAAMVAERFPGGLAIGAAIRAVPPTINEVLGAGYDPKDAAAIVLEEKRKYEAGEPPYGPEPVSVLAPGPVLVPASDPAPAAAPATEAQKAPPATEAQ